MIKYISGGVCAANGFKAAGIHCGIRKNTDKKDLALIVSDKEATAAAVYTQNLVKGAPITVTKKNIADGKAMAVICNSGNANTCNANGIEIAEQMCELTEKYSGIKKNDVIVASTGVIGQPLSIEPIADKMDELVKSLKYNNSNEAATAIMTTDTVQKEAAVSFEINGVECKLGGMANGMAGNKEITEECDEFKIFKKALNTVTVNLCRKIAGDGEGASKLLECIVTGAKSDSEAKNSAKSVICSSLLKAAMFGADANWGRVLCALGYSGEDLDVNKIDVGFKSEKGEILVCKNGAGVDFSEEKAKEILLEKEIKILVDLNEGEYSATAWGCDLTYDYVKINGDYRS